MSLPATYSGAQRSGRTAALVFAAALSWALPVAAQTIDCNRLSAQITAMGQSSGGDGSARYQAAAARQRAELGRTTSYARQLGCDRQNFLFFGPPRPPQCDGLNAQIQRMQSNLGQLQQLAGGDGNARRSLQAQFAAYCGASRTRGFFDDLFNGPQRRPLLENELPPVDEQQRAEDRDAPRGGPLAVCVRSCDGGFFPVSYSARRGSLSDLQELCTALCPNTEAKIYTRSLARDMKTAVSLDGEAYTQHPNAFKFEKAFDKTCACKAQGATWADTLAEAERVLGTGRKTDIIVTPEKAEELSRAQPAGAGKRAKFDPAAKALEAKPVPDVIDSATIIDDAMSAQAPTASKDSAGISTTPATTATVQRRAEGEMKTVTDADGATKKVRVIAPRL